MRLRKDLVLDDNSTGSSHEIFTRDLHTRSVHEPPFWLSVFSIISRERPVQKVGRGGVLSCRTCFYGGGGLSHRTCFTVANLSVETIAGRCWMDQLKSRRPSQWEVESCFATPSSISIDDVPYHRCHKIAHPVSRVVR